MTSRRSFLISLVAVPTAMASARLQVRETPGLEILDSRGRVIAASPEGNFAVSIAMVEDRRRRKCKGLEKFIIEYKHDGAAPVEIARVRRVGPWPAWADNLNALDRNEGLFPVTLRKRDALHFTWQVFTHSPQDGVMAITDV